MPVALEQSLAKPSYATGDQLADPVRQELDRRLLTEALGIDDKAVEQLDILRRQWCSEPTVTSTKKTGPAQIAGQRK